jgi:hypothetical protein
MLNNFDREDMFLDDGILFERSPVALASLQRGRRPANGTTHAHRGVGLLLEEKTLVKI